MTPKTYAAAAALCAASVATSANAASVFQARVSPIGVGSYEFKVADLVDVDGDILSADVGLSYISALADDTALIFDLELEYFAISADGGGEFDRTDAKFTAGYKTAANITPFIGYRQGYQGDGFFDDEFAEETGFFLGASYSGLELGDAGRLTLSLAYNLNNYDFGGGDFDTKGIGAKVSFLLNALPIAFNLKYQTFTEDEDIGGDYEENYLTLNATWYFWNSAN